MDANKSSSEEIEYSSSLFEKMNLNTKYIQKTNLLTFLKFHVSRVFLVQCRFQ